MAYSDPDGPSSVMVILADSNQPPPGGTAAHSSQYSPGHHHHRSPHAWSTPCVCGCYCYEACCMPCAAADVAEHLSPHHSRFRYCCCTCLIASIPYVGPCMATCRLWDLRQKLMERDRIPYDDVGFWWLLCCSPCFLAQERRHVADREQQQQQHSRNSNPPSPGFSSSPAAAPPGIDSFASPPGLALRGAAKEW